MLTFAEKHTMSGHYKFVLIFIYFFCFLEKSKHYLDEAQQWTHPLSHEPQWFDESNTVWKSITKVLIWVLPCFNLSVWCAVWELCTDADSASPGQPQCLYQLHTPPFLPLIHPLHPIQTLMNPHFLDVCIDENFYCSAGDLSNRNRDFYLLKYFELAA